MGNTEVKISKILKQLGILPNLSGYGYSKEAINMVLEDDSAVRRGVTKVIYPAVARKFHTTSSRVERAIRHAVERAWTRGDAELMEDIFGWGISADRGKPTNSEFIAGVADYIKLGEKSEE